MEKKCNNKVWKLSKSFHQKTVSEINFFTDAMLNCIVVRKNEHVGSTFVNKTILVRETATAPTEMTEIKALTGLLYLDRVMFCSVMQLVLKLF